MISNSNHDKEVLHIEPSTDIGLKIGGGVFRI